MLDVTDHASLIAALGGAAEIAADPRLDTLPVNVRAWAARNRIPPEHWPGLIQLSGDKGRQVTAEWLMHTTPARRRQEQPSSSDATALCGRCGERAEAPSVISCTSVHCPMREKEAA